MIDLEVVISGMTTVQLTETANVLSQIDETSLDLLPDSFPDILEHYMGLESEQKKEFVSELSGKANFRAYAESMGKPEMVDALTKVVEDLDGLNRWELAEVAEAGVSAFQQ